MLAEVKRQKKKAQKLEKRNKTSSSRAKGEVLSKPSVQTHVFEYENTGRGNIRSK